MFFVFYYPFGPVDLFAGWNISRAPRPLRRAAGVADNDVCNWWLNGTSLIHHPFLTHTTTKFYIGSPYLNSAHTSIQSQIHDHLETGKREQWKKKSKYFIYAYFKKLKLSMVIIVVDGKLLMSWSWLLKDIGRIW